MKSSSIQTILSVSELHRFSAYALADFTAGRESHPALKMYELMLFKEYHVGSILVKPTNVCYNINDRFAASRRSHFVSGAAVIVPPLGITRYRSCGTFR